MGAESGHTAGVTVAVPHRYTHDAAHGHTSFMIYRKKEGERERERGTLTAVDYTLGITKSRKLLLGSLFTRFKPDSTQFGSTLVLFQTSWDQ